MNPLLTLILLLLFFSCDNSTEPEVDIDAAYELADEHWSFENYVIRYYYWYNNRYDLFENK